MCGLIGGTGDRVVTHDHLDLIHHRGPDSRGMTVIQDETLGQVTLGMTRLAIQDTREIADQPFIDGPITLTYNGELWNARDLRDALPGPWETTGDTEVVARALREWGTDALPRFDGMWAIAWYDTRADSGLFLARDDLGRVPLYTQGLYPDTPIQTGVAWASERKALAQIVLEPTKAVPPGHYINITRGHTVDYRQPWEAQPATPQTCLRLLRAGVAQRLVSDRPICFMLSGGIDSTLILGLALELGAKDVVAYTSVGDPNSPDLHYARKVAKHFNIQLVEVPVPQPTEQLIRQAIWTIETTMPAQVEIALAHIPLAQQASADGFRVCLSGEAADEIFGGYRQHIVQASKGNDDHYRDIKRKQLAKMARGNFMRVNKSMMAHGIEGRLPYVQQDLVRMALQATITESPQNKGLLKAAARLSGVVPEEVITRKKHTYQRGVGTDSQARLAIAGTTQPSQGPNPDMSHVTAYNRIAIKLFGHRPTD